MDGATTATGGTQDYNDDEHNGDVAGLKLVRLRQAMKDRDLDVYLVPTDDPHLSGT
jgi:hypothetical protein